MEPIFRKKNTGSRCAFVIIEGGEYKAETKAKKNKYKKIDNKQFATIRAEEVKESQETSIL